MKKNSATHSDRGQPDRVGLLGKSYAGKRVDLLRHLRADSLHVEVMVWV